MKPVATEVESAGVGTKEIDGVEVGLFVVITVLPIDGFSDIVGGIDGVLDGFNVGRPLGDALVDG